MTAAVWQWSYFHITSAHKVLQVDRKRLEGSASCTRVATMHQTAPDQAPLINLPLSRRVRFAQALHRAAHIASRLPAAGYAPVAMPFLPAATPPPVFAHVGPVPCCMRFVAPHGRSSSRQCLSQ
jgi:hypothetical protein